jgi:hypothetical protein
MKKQFFIFAALSFMATQNANALNQHCKAQAMRFLKMQNIAEWGKCPTGTSKCNFSEDKVTDTPAFDIDFTNGKTISTNGFIFLKNPPKVDPNSKIRPTPAPGEPQWEIKVTSDKQEGYFSKKSMKGVHSVTYIFKPQSEGTVKAGDEVTKIQEDCPYRSIKVEFTPEGSNKTETREFSASQCSDFAMKHETENTKVDPELTNKAKRKYQFKGSQDLDFYGPYCWQAWKNFEEPYIGDLEKKAKAFEKQPSQIPDPTTYKGSK